MKSRVFYAILIFIVSLSACKKEESENENNTNNNNNNNTTLTISSPNQFVGTIGGTSYTYSNTAGHLHGQGSLVHTDAGTGMSTASYSSSFSEFADFLFGVGNGSLTYSGQTPPSADLENLFSVGSHAYSINSENGVEVSWMDSNGTLWTTSNGSADQSSSTFEILETVLESNTEIKVLMNFSCTLYDDSGSSMQLTDGQMVGVFSSDW